MTARPGLHEVALSPQQAEVLRRLARGEDTPQIAREMRLTVGTARGYYRDVLERLGAVNAAHAVGLGIGHGLIPADAALIRGESDA